MDPRSILAVDHAINKYLSVGPMIGTFGVYGSAFDLYGESEFVDEIFFPHPSHWTWGHVVVITGFGVQGIYPFWEFQNSYGPLWRGAARGFGQLYAVYVLSLYMVLQWLSCMSCRL
uniref:Peptidase C1A papain C-terminal domain-containing protein n=1 Tax=Oryza meridionalis TaxID=40149 RepID=A0A0E0CTZ4_9ORYZ